MQSEPRNPHLHPVFRGIVNAISVQPGLLRMAAYETALRRFDWAFEWSDDAAYVRRTRVTLADMRSEQRALDPQGELWNVLCREQTLRVQAGAQYAAAADGALA